MEEIRKKKTFKSFLKKINYKKLIKYVIILGVLVFVGIKVFGIFQKKQPEQKEAAIQTEKPQIRDIEKTLTGKGTVEPNSQYKVSALVKGEILSAPFEEGQQVKKGDVLFQVSTKDVKNGIESAKISLQKANKLYQESQEKLNDLTGYSDVTGRVTEVKIKKGDNIQAGMEIAHVTDNSRMTLEIPFNAAEVNQNWIGKKAVVEIADNAGTLNGTVTKISPEKTALAGNMLVRKVTIEVKNPGGITKETRAEATVGESICNADGTFLPLTDESITAKHTGKIASLYLKEEHMIKKGDKIYSLDREDIDNEIENSRLTIKEAELSLENQNNQLENYTVTAPISGEVITKNKNQGDTIDMSSDANNGVLAVIYDLSSLVFKMNVDELDIRNVSVGQEVIVTADALPGELMKGKVDRISLQGTTTNGVTSYPVTIRLSKHKGLLPGMNVNGRIVTESVKGTISISANAIVRNNMVYVKDKTQKTVEKDKTGKKEKDNKQQQFGGVPEGFKEVPVETGISDGLYIQIISGLTEEDEVYIPAAASGGMGDMSVPMMDGAAYSSTVVIE